MKLPLVHQEIIPTIIIYQEDSHPVNLARLGISELSSLSPTTRALPSPGKWHRRSRSPREQPRRRRPNNDSADAGNATVLPPRLGNRNRKDVPQYRSSHSPSRLPTRDHEHSRSPAHVWTSISFPSQRNASGSLYHHWHDFPLLPPPINHGRRPLTYTAVAYFMYYIYCYFCLLYVNHEGETVHTARLGEGVVPLYLSIATNKVWELYRIRNVRSK